MTYVQWLLVASLTFLVLERLRPERPHQKLLRPQFANDMFYLLFNGHFYAVVAGGAVAWSARHTRDLLDSVGALPEHGLLDDAPWIVAFLVYMFVNDFMQWCVHVSLHKIPFLWEFHKLHHSVVDMDWAGNFRFHWVEIVVYRSLLYIPLFFLGGPIEALFPVWVAGTFWGHFNHANLQVDIGRLGYLMNSPRMHLWHHDASTEGGVGKNYGIVLSLWDFLFGTAYWPRDRNPKSLGYPGIEKLPRLLPGQLIWPLSALLPSARKS
ncbi:MAG: sterol desaturase/sphingolipid hydroxylase (fatty acid hydroxylase superfamily) [Candidatus Paceibacteria bacterium]|jgi:sterol desaturase/sphingolipid hydroxylase (fatty acid hydroxylase superfamily)